jgi:hypothetical protein
MVALRRKLVATVDDAIDEASAYVLKPISDARLEAKFHGLADDVRALAVPG